MTEKLDYKGTVGQLFKGAYEHASNEERIRLAYYLNRKAAKAEHEHFEIRTACQKHYWLGVEQELDWVPVK
jgi:hypothetical protein